MKYYISAILAMLMWSSSFIATKITYQSFSPVLLCLIRFSFSFILLFLYRHITHITTRLSKEDKRTVFLSASGGISLYYTLENIALSLTSASMTSLIEAAYPVLTVIVGVLIYHERTSKRMLFGIGISIIGVLLLTGITVGTNNNTGNILLIIAGVLWGFYNYLVQRIPAQYDSVTITYYQMLYGSLGFIPLLILETPVCTNISPATVFSVLYLSAGCSVGALLLYNFGLKGIPASHASALMNVMPLFGVILSAIILHESITFNQIIGGMIVMVGVVISTKKST